MTDSPSSDGSETEPRPSITDSTDSTSGAEPSENATLEHAPGVRQGSPFREGSQREPESKDAADSVTEEREENVPVEHLDVGAMQSTATGAALASAMILVFAFASVVSFPGGGVFVAPLGCLLAVSGMASRLVKTSVICLALHLICFAASFIRMT